MCGDLPWFAMVPWRKLKDQFLLLDLNWVYIKYIDPMYIDFLKELKISNYFLTILTAVNITSQNDLGSRGFSILEELPHRPDIANSSV